MIRVNNCCGCCSLKAGICTYGILMLISRGYFLIRLTIVAIDNASNLSCGYSSQSSSSYESPSNADCPISNKFIYILAAFIIISIILLIVALVGVTMEKRALLFPHMAMMGIQMTFEIIAVVVGTNWLFFALDACLQVYIFICMCSFYDELKEKEQKSVLPVKNSEPETN